MHISCTFVELATVLTFIAKSQEVANLNKRASLMLLSKEANTKDVPLQSQLMMSFQDEDATKGASEFIWPKHGYFGEHNIDLTIPKANFPELTICYVNQSRVSMVKSGEKAIYCDNVILAQIMPLITIDPSIDLNSYVPNENQVIIYVP